MMKKASQSSNVLDFYSSPGFKMKVILLTLCISVAIAQHYGGNSGYGPDGVRNRYFILGHGKVGPISTSIYGPSLGHNSYRSSSSDSYRSSGHSGSSGNQGGYRGASDGHSSAYGAGSSAGHDSYGPSYGSGLSSGIYGPSASHSSYDASRGADSGAYGAGYAGAPYGHGAYGSSRNYGSALDAYRASSTYGSSSTHASYGPSSGSHSGYANQGSYAPEVNSHSSYAPAASQSYAPSRSYSAPSLGHGLYGPSAGRGYGSYGGHDDHAQPTPYDFGYNVHNEHGDQLSRQESGDGHGNVKGSYGYRDGYGIYRHVEYVADHDGFRANVRTNEPGTENQDPADVHMQVEHGGYGGAY